MNSSAGQINCNRADINIPSSYDSDITSPTYIAILIMVVSLAVLAHEVSALVGGGSMGIDVFPIEKWGDG